MSFKVGSVGLLWDLYLTIVVTDAMNVLILIWMHTWIAFHGAYLLLSRSIIGTVFPQELLLMKIGSEVTQYALLQVEFFQNPHGAMVMCKDNCVPVWSAITGHMDRSSYIKLKYFCLT